MRYSVVITQEPDGSAYNVRVPALPGCNTWGETYEEAVANAHRAIRGHVAALVATNQPVPVETVAPTVVAVDVDAA